ncbi:MAG: 50S ribosomal protein L10 [Puniceicoccales bacterium]|jgi:large subunit ribosomal protein L10|nr:50S ribosomal protein L10 [Puniceicoccales bacterium]
MREEKKYLVAELVEHLNKSDYMFLVAFDRLNVADVAVLRKKLREMGAEYHVVKNSILRLAVLEKSLPEFAADALRSATAIVVGGSDPSGVAKAICEFAGEREWADKLRMKSGILDGRQFDGDGLVALSKLPPIGALRAQFLALLQAAPKNFLFVCSAAAQSFLRLLVAYGKGNS